MLSLTLLTGSICTFALPVLAAKGLYDAYRIPSGNTDPLPLPFSS